MAIACIPEGIVSRHRSRFENCPPKGPPKVSVSSAIAAQAHRLCHLLSLEGLPDEQPRVPRIGGVARSWQRRPPCNPATPRGVHYQRLQDGYGGQARAAAPPWVDTPRGMEPSCQETKREIWVEDDVGKAPRATFDAKSLIQSLPWNTLGIGIIEDEDMSESGFSRSASFTSSSFTSPLMEPRRMPQRSLWAASLVDQRAQGPAVSTAATLLRSSSPRITVSRARVASSTPSKREKQTTTPTRSSSSTSAGEAVINFTEELRDKICTVFQNPGLCIPESNGLRKQRLSTGEIVVGECSSRKSRPCSRQDSRDMWSPLEKLDLVMNRVVPAAVESVMQRQTSRRGGA